MSIGANFCVLCDYPELESEQWSTSCAGDQDEMCSCTIIDVLPGLQLCFNGFQASCSRDYQCNVSFMTEFQTSLVCSAEAVFVATSEFDLILVIMSELHIIELISLIACSAY